MSKGNWIIAVAFGLAFLTSVGFGIWAVWSLEEYYSNDRKDIAERYYSEPHGSVEACRSSPNFFAALECVNNTVAAKHDEYTSYKDLKAQQHMSLAALGVLIVSTITMTVTAVGVIFVWQTLNKSAETNRIALDVFSGENPPRFGIKQVSLNLEEWVDPAKRQGELWVYNAGPTEAVITHSTLVFHVGKRPPPARPFDQAPNANPMVATGTTIGSGWSAWWKFTGVGCAASVSDIEDALERIDGIGFFMIGRIHYTTRRGTWKRHTVFCREFDNETGRFVVANEPDYEYQS